MRLPMFTAEASLYTSDGYYDAAASSSTPEAAGGVVTPQLPRGGGKRWRCWDERIQGVLLRCCAVEGQEPFCWFDHWGYPGRPV